MPTMKHILRKLHIGGSHENFGDRHHEVGGRILENGENSIGVSGHTETDQRLSSGISGWLNNARHTLRPLHVPHGGSRPRLNSPGAANTSSDASRTRSQDADDRIGFQYYEEEYQVQLALALSVSNSDVRDDPESVQIRAAKRISLGRPPSPGNTPAEFISHKYRNYNVLDYEEKVVDGFYDVYGVVSDFGAMSSLVDLQGTPVTDNLGYEVILVNRAMDPDLVQLEQTALCLALDCGSGEASSYQSCLIQKIADLVVEHMGGPVTDTTDMLKRWRVKNYELRGSLNDIVLPLGCLRVGTSRHRALLYKVLSDHVGVPCRLVKGSHYTGTDGAINIVKLDNGREYIIDLMGSPGALLPAEVVGATLQIDQVDNRNLPNRIEETVLSSSNGEGRRFNGPSKKCGHTNCTVDLLTEDVGKSSNEESLYNEPAKVGSAAALPEWFEKGMPDFISCWEHGSTIEGDIKGALLQVMENVPQETANMAPRNIHANSFGVDNQLGPCQMAERIKSTMSEESDCSAGFLKPLNGNEFEHQFVPFSSRTTSLLPMAMVDGLQAVPERSAHPDSADLIVAAAKPNLLKEMERPNTLTSARKDASSVFLSHAAHSLPQLAEQSGDRLLREMPATADKLCSHLKLRDGRYTSNNGRNGQADFHTNADEKIGGKEQKILKSHNYPSGKASPVLDDVAEWEIPWEDITIGDRIGLGSYGEVYHGVWHGTEVAVKKLLDQGLCGDALDDFISEVRIMRRMQHPNVILFMGAVTRTPNLSIVTEYLPRGSLFRLLHHPHNQLDEKVRLKMALDVAKGMNYLHTSVPVIVHRDLKSPNLLVDKNWVVKVCDFGLSRTKHRTFLSSRSTAGTPEWMAPEVLRNEPSNEKCDVYSFGVILWELVTLQEPWSWMNPMQVVGAVGFQSRRLELPKNVDPTVASIIHECWQSDPRKRPSFAQLITALKSLQRLNVVQLLN